jgi:microcompartment protein CcmK/EutM
MSNLSELLPAGAGAKSADFVASGTLSSGQTVALKSDGTVEAVTETFDPTTSVSTPVSFYTAIGRVSSAYDSNSGKIVVSFNDNSTSHLKCVVGTVSGSTISFGSVVTVSTVGGEVSIIFDSTNNKVVISYSGASGYLNAVVGTVSGTSISFGTPTVAYSSNTQYLTSTFDSGNGKVILGWQNIGSANAEYRGIVGTVSGTGISFGTSLDVSFSTEVTYCNVIYEPDSGRIVFIASNFFSGTFSYLYTVSGTSLTYNSYASISANRIQYSSSSAVGNSKIVLSGKNLSNSSYGTSFVGTISGTTISYGSAVVFSSSSTTDTATSYDSTIDRVVVSYEDSGNTDDGEFVVGTVSGTSISFSSSTTFDSGEVGFMSSAYDSNNKKIVTAYKDAAGAGAGDAVVITAGSLTSNNTDFIGITDAAISSAATGTVIVQGGVSATVTGLTANTNYYVQGNGTISAVVSTVPAGRALSSTSILLEG